MTSDPPEGVPDAAALDTSEAARVQRERADRVADAFSSAVELTAAGWLRRPAELLAPLVGCLVLLNDRELVPWFYSLLQASGKERLFRWFGMFRLLVGVWPEMAGRISVRGPACDVETVEGRAAIWSARVLQALLMPQWSGLAEHTREEFRPLALERAQQAAARALVAIVELVADVPGLEPDHARGNALALVVEHLLAGLPAGQLAERPEVVEGLRRWIGAVVDVAETPAAPSVVARFLRGWREFPAPGPGWMSVLVTGPFPGDKRSDDAFPWDEPPPVKRHAPLCGLTREEVGSCTCDVTPDGPAAVEVPASCPKCGGACKPGEVTARTWVCTSCGALGRRKAAPTGKGGAR